MPYKSQDENLRLNIKQEKEKRIEIERSGDRNLEPNLKAISKALDDYYFVNKLRVYCAFLSYKNIVTTEVIKYKSSDLLLIKEILKHLDKTQISNPSLIVYNQIRKLYESIDVYSNELNRLFKSTLSLVKEYKKIHSKEENLEMYALLINYCIRKINQGKKDYQAIFLGVNLYMMDVRYDGVPEKEIFIEPAYFRNIVVTALIFEDTSFFSDLKMYGFMTMKSNRVFKNQFEWVEEFIEYYGSKMGKGNLARYYSQYCKALLEFKRGRFEKAYKIFNNPMRVQGTFLNLDIKILHLKILYEINIEKDDILEYEKIEVRKVLDAYNKLIKYEVSKKQELSYQISYYVDFKDKYNILWNLFYRYSGRIGNQKNAAFLKKKETLLRLIKQFDSAHNQWFLEKNLLIK